MYAEGQGVPQDYAEAVGWFRKAAEQGDAGAQFNLGLMNKKGQGLPQDCAEAVRWFRKAAEQGDAGAQANLGLMHCDSLELQRKLRNLGYDLTVAQSDKPGELTITSKDFDDTDHRVRFLSLLRSRNSPAAEVCLAGFQTVRLKTPGDLFGFFGFSQTYSLECFNWR